MRLALALLAPLALLAACQQPAPAPDEPTPPPSITLGGVDLGQPVAVRGNEPFWAVDITPTQLKYYGPDRPEQLANNPGPVVQGTTAVFTAMTGQNNALVVTLIDTDCSDGMSDRLYPLTAQVQIGTETLSGCAISQAEFDAGGEGGGDQTAEVTPPAQ